MTRIEFGAMFGYKHRHQKTLRNTFGDSSGFYTNVPLTKPNALLPDGFEASRFGAGHLETSRHVGTCSPTLSDSLGVWSEVPWWP